MNPGDPRSKTFIITKKDITIYGGFMENVTPEEQYAILELSKISGFIDRDKGTGRPTKKDRRSLESFLDTDWTEE